MDDRVVFGRVKGILEGGLGMRLPVFFGDGDGERHCWRWSLR